MFEVQFKSKLGTGCSNLGFLLHHFSGKLAKVQASYKLSIAVANQSLWTLTSIVHKPKPDVEDLREKNLDVLSWGVGVLAARFEQLNGWSYSQGTQAILFSNHSKRGCRARSELLGCSTINIVRLASMRRISADILRF